MAAKRGLSVWNFGLLIVLSGSCFAACGGNAQTGGPGAAAGGSSDGGPDNAGAPSETAGRADVEAKPSVLGWSIRDATPYSRNEHATVLDEGRDRMIVIGGAGGMDVWALPLSGPDKHRWSQILPEGNAPPVDEQNIGQAASAVYDPFGQRVLVLRADSYQFETPRIWELTLDDIPTWHELELEGPAPGAELDQGKIVVDRDGKRALIVGGGKDSSGTWALSLDGPARWARIADAPAQESYTRSPFPVGINVGSLFIDPPRARLVLISASVDKSAAWTLPLTGGDWALESRAPSCGPDYETSSSYDWAHERVLFLGRKCGISSYSLATGEWQSSLASNWVETHDESQLIIATSSIDDRKRGRALFFSGGLSPGNATTALSYGDLKLSVLVPNTLGVAPSSATGVWDEQRQALIALGSFRGTNGATRAHGLNPTDSWREVADSPPPLSDAVYDPIGHAVVAVGYPDDQASSATVARLASKPGSVWEVIAAPDGPQARTGPVLVYDSVRQRVVLHGGSSYTGTETISLSDTWTLSFSGETQWTELATTGDSGETGFRRSAIFDPVAQRMIVYGSVDDNSGAAPGELFQLALDDSLEWSALPALGRGPTHYGGLALYDPHGERMLVLDKTHLYALTLNASPTWHRFCEPGMTMPGSISLFLGGNDPATTLLGLAPDGLFAALGDGAFRFDLDTPYCD